MQIYRKRFEIEAWYQLPTNRKPYGGSNDDVIDDVTWPWKVKIMTPISSRPVILKMAW